MGCDIHTMLERKRTVNNEGKWVNIDYWKLNPYYNQYPEDESKMDRVEFYDGRNYSLFSILAGVRNYGNNKPISDPKGIPEDSCEIIKKEYEEWGCCAHSASYFTLKELMDFYKDNPNQKLRGMLSPQQQNDLDNGLLPDGWCQGTNMEGYEFREWENESDLKWFIDPLIKRAKEELWIWHDDNNEKVYQQADSIRVVFWFDN